MKIETSMTKSELIAAAIMGLEIQLSRIKDRIRIIRKQLAGEVYVIDTGQPCCPVHGNDYRDDVCATCANLCGVSLPNAGATHYTKQPGHKKFKFSKKSRMKMAAAQKERWRLRKLKSSKRRAA